jgi:alkylated DNA repair protein alkB family protein 6
VDKIMKLHVFDQKQRPNHVLVNEYLPGQGIMPHEDGPVFHSIICTINLNSHTILNLWPKLADGSEMVTGSGKVALLLEPKSLVIIKDGAYTNYLHGIDQVTSDVLDLNICNLTACPGREVGDEVTRDRRISCTIRFVPNMRMDLLSLLRK